MTRRLPRILLIALFLPLGAIPATEPADSVKLMKPAAGLVAKLFAAEPDVRQPIFVKCDDRGRVWTIQYLQYPNPAGLKRVKVDRWSRTVYDRVPEPPPKGPKGDDRITICEDTDGDGKADRFRDFVTGLNLCTGVEFGHGGVFVLQAPYLLFYRSKNGDTPDGDPEVLLSGFGMEDAQSLANHLTWGPDGWLYGLNGSTTTCRIRGIEFQQGVWRYHPRTKEFELFCEGGGNVYGLTFDDCGNLFYSSNLGLFWHAHQGAYYLKNVGKHGPLHNPYAYGHLMHVNHDAPTGGPSTGGMIYRGDTFPERFRGRFLAGDFLRHTASTWELERSGATVKARAKELLLDSRDDSFGATDLCLGPDGSVFVSDFHDMRTAHPDPDADWDRNTGRIWKIEAAGLKPLPKFDLAKKTSPELVELLKHPNGWYGDRARVLLAERRDVSTWPMLRAMATEESDDRFALQGLWTLHASGGFTDELALKLLKHKSPQVRAWTVRLLGDAKKLTNVAPLLQLTAKETSPVVRAQLFCTAKRLPGDQALPILQMAIRSRDTSTEEESWFLWWAIESKAITNRVGVTGFFANPENFKHRGVSENIGRLIRRYASEGTEQGCDTAVFFLDKFEGNAIEPHLRDLDRGLAERAVALPGVGQGGLFDNLAAPDAPKVSLRKVEPISKVLRELIAKEWARMPADELRTRLALRAELPEAVAAVKKDLAEGKSLQHRLAVLEVVGDESFTDSLLPLLASKDVEVQKRALGVLGRIGGASTGAALLKAIPALPAALQPRVREILFSRAEWAKAFLLLIEQKKLAADSVPVEQVRLLALLGDKDIDAVVRKHWGNVKPGTPEEKLAEVRRFTNDLRAGAGDGGKGKALFVKHCGACHKLFGEGGAIGPELTNTSRSDTAWLLASVVDPNSVIRTQYVQAAVNTTDGTVKSGIVAEQDAASLTLVDAKGEKTRIPRDRIESVRDLPTSLMPEKLLDALSPQERRDLFKYLQQAKP